MAFLIDFQTNVLLYDKWHSVTVSSIDDIMYYVLDYVVNLTFCSYVTIEPKPLAYIYFLNL